MPVTKNTDLNQTHGNVIAKEVSKVSQNNEEGF